MYDYNKSLVCKQHLGVHNLDLSKFTDEDNYRLGVYNSVDDLPLMVPLWRKHNILAYNFTLETGVDDTPVIYCNLVGEEEDFTNYFNDFVSNREHYLEQIKDTFENGPEPEKISDIIEERERMDNFRTDPPERLKYNAKQHGFELNQSQNAQEVNDVSKIM